MIAIDIDFGISQTVEAWYRTSLLNNGDINSTYIVISRRQRLVLIYETKIEGFFLKVAMFALGSAGAKL